MKKSFDESVDSNDLAKQIKERKGNVTNRIENANMIVCDENNWDDNIKLKLVTAIEDNVPIINSEYLVECFGQKKIKTKDLEKEQPYLTSELYWKGCPKW